MDLPALHLVASLRWWHLQRMLYYFADLVEPKSASPILHSACLGVLEILEPQMPVEALTRLLCAFHLRRAGQFLCFLCLLAPLCLWARLFLMYPAERRYQGDQESARWRTSARALLLCALEGSLGHPF